METKMHGQEDGDDWIFAEHAFLYELSERLIESALDIAVKRDPFARKEGGGIWNRSRAPHCYGFEYEQHFGRPLTILTATKEHERLWRSSSWWPNVPPVDHFYSDNFDYQKQCMELFVERAKERHSIEIEDRKKRRRAYDLAYNEVRRKRRREKRHREQAKLRRFNNNRVLT